MTIAVGAAPVFADIVGWDEPTIDPVDVERRVNDRTKAVVVMHYGGHTCRMAEIQEICHRHRLALIEDACHAVGGSYMHLEGRPPHGKSAGTLGDIACFSFFSNKNLATGEGGMVVTDRDDLAERVRLLRSHGMTTLSWERYQGHASRYDVVLNGYNYRMDDIRAALGRVQLSKLERGNSRRRKLMSAYRQEFQNTDWLVPFANHAGISAAHLMVVVAATEAQRRAAMEALAGARIQTSMHYPCLSGFTAFQRHPSAGLDRSIEFGRRALTLPLYPDLAVTSVMEICAIVRQLTASGVGKAGA
jgi:dTDP-4-amino-4,6-dideoxygalactose transaminase